MVQINPVVYALLQAHISEHISLKARAQTVALVLQKPEFLEMQKKDPQRFQIEFDSALAQRIAVLTVELQQAEQGTEKPDELVLLKQRELDLKAMDLQRKAQEFAVEEQRKGEEFDERLDLDKMKREDAEEAGKDRIKIGEEKINLQKEKLRQDVQKR